MTLRPGGKLSFGLHHTVRNACLLALAAFFYLCFLPVDVGAQKVLSVAMLLFLYVSYRYSTKPSSQRHQPIIRLIVIFVALFLSSRYIYWRATETLPLQFGIVAMVLGLALFLAECYGYINNLFGYFINSNPLQRKSVLLPDDPNLLPHVDVYIPTYNEDSNVLWPTVIAATQLRYPREKLHVYLLDDGGTHQKCNDKDPVKAVAARARAKELQGIAARFGAKYLTRAKNEHAKAGNMNSALQYTNGDLILILDCDHIPTEDFLEKTVGLFLTDPKLFVVQTPHNFISPDPLERNLATFESSPAENELFYDVMHPGLDAWGTSFFCGSAALLRRSVIDQLGGISGQTITEDAETTLDAMGLGYSTAYLNRPMVSGLQPETYSAFVVQRVRWGQGMLQIFLLKNPWKLPGLTLVQRLLYTNLSFYWGFAVSRLIMMLAPPVFLIFTINLCDATTEGILIYAAPSLAASLITTQYFYGRVRWPFMSQLYEIIQSIYVSQGLFAVLRKPRSPSFQVTPKGEVMANDAISGLTKPFYLLLAVNIVGIIYGVARFNDGSWDRSAVAFVLFWAFFDCVLLLGALGVMFERRQLRSEPRARCNEPVILQMPDNLAFHGVARNASVSGMGLTIDGDATLVAYLKEHPALSVLLPRLGVALTGRAQAMRVINPTQISIGLSYCFSTIEQERAAVAVAFGSSDQIIDNNSSRHAGKSVLRGFMYLLKFAGVKGTSHIIFALKAQITRLLQSKQLQKDTSS
jgi:cellulose synthase (UDP-forming)